MNVGFSIDGRGVDEDMEHYFNYDVIQSIRAIKSTGKIRVVLSAFTFDDEVVLRNVKFFNVMGIKIGTVSVSACTEPRGSETWKDFFLKKLKVAQEDNILKLRELKKELIKCANADTAFAAINYK